MPMSARVAPLPGAARASLRLDPVGEALRGQLADADPALAAAYRARGYQPVWIRGWGLRPDAGAVVAAVNEAAADGLDPDDYGAPGLPAVLAAARSGKPEDLARAEVALSRAAGGYLTDLHTPRPGAEMIYADAAVAPPRLDPGRVVHILGRARSPAEAFARLRRMNPIYQALREDLAAWQARGGEAAVGALIRANLERARALPPDLGRRYVLVNAAAQTLWLYEDGRPVESMAVVVGKPSEPTPAMAGLIRYAVARPYWNVPPDLVQHSIAPKVLRYGPAWLDGQNMEVLSDWSADAQVVPAETVDWTAVASGAQMLRVRQRPGPRNMMGQVKFIFPNPLGVYLHDTPLRQFFAERTRTESAGCVRLADARRLARWLLAARVGELDQAGAPESRLDLDRPVPVYIVYLTAAPAPSADGLVFRRDIYHRDPPLEAKLAASAKRA